MCCKELGIILYEYNLNTPAYIYELARNYGPPDPVAGAFHKAVLSNYSEQFKLTLSMRANVCNWCRIGLSQTTAYLSIPLVHLCTDALQLLDGRIE